VNPIPSSESISPSQARATVHALSSKRESTDLWLGEIAHYATGLIAFPIGFILICTLLSLRPSTGNGLLWGLALWEIAGIVPVPLSGGALFFGMGKTMMASLVAHLAYGATLGFLYQRRR
jgi:hypothetical protein